MEGDFLATQAFAFACSGSVPLALKALEDSEEVTNHLEARTLRAFTRAVTEDAGQESATPDQDLLDQALGVARETGNFDGFVLAYRGCPKILASLSSDRVANRPFIDLVRSLDRQLATRFGLRDKPRDQTQVHPLTPREREVFDLVRQGLSNREIARSLWISESTVKVHIRHVFEKLGAKSRTEAAALAPPAES
jgi:DNA-binding CsgD family transcriptional regulator